MVKTSKTYLCQDCNTNFDQKSHYDRHINKKIPCILKDKPLNEVIKEAINKEISKQIKETEKQIIIQKTVISSDSSENDLIDINEKKTKKNKEKAKPKVKSTKESQVELDLSYLRLSNNNNIIFKLKDDGDNKNKSISTSNILKMIDKGHQILYNSENIEGEDALNDIMNFMFIKCIQPLISDKKEDGKIDLLNKEYYKHIYDDAILDEILSYFKDLSNLANAELDAIRNMNDDTDAIRQMGDILKLHPLTKQIYTENNFIKAKKSPTVQSLLNQVICKINIKELEENEDTIGEIYEHIINGYNRKGSKLGQFFTPRKLMKLISKYKEPRVHQILSKITGDIRLYDSCLGTGGWMVYGHNMLKEKYPNRLLLSGGEVKPSTFQYGLMNLILTIKKFPHDVQCESSLTHINKIKHHLIWTNPPFQTDKKFVEVEKNFKDDKFTKENKIKLDDVYSLKDNSPPIQFLELDFYKLEDNGLCFIVLPYGELFFSSSYSDNRKYFMKETNITDIILFEGGIFTHTGIKTCVMIFEKDRTGTKNINFLKANKECNNLTMVTSVSIDDIEKEPNLSWYLRDYLKDEHVEELCIKMTNFEWIEFGDIFTLEKGKLQSSKVEEVENGKILFISKSEITEDTRKIISNTYYNEGLFITNAFNGNGKCPIRYTEEKCIHSDLLLKININDKYTEKINLKYIYYFLISIKKHIEKIYGKGSCNQSLDQKNFNRIKIPIPTLEDQKKIINNIIELEDVIDINKKARDSTDKMLVMYMEAMLKGASNKGINKIMRFGEVVEYLQNGKRKSSEGSEEGLYPLYYCSINNVLYMDEYDFDDEAITMNITNGSGKCNIFHPNGKYSVAETTLHFKSKDENIITTNILYNYLWLIKKSIAKLYKGTQQMSIRKEDLNIKINIPIPPIEYQKKMEETINKIDYLRQNYIKTIKDVDDNIKTAFMNSLDSYGNPDSFNLEKILENLDNNEIIK